MQISEKPSYKLTDSLLFLFITLVFLLFFILTFKGFDGSDDMHYAMPASQVLRQRFDPFFAADISTGRLGLIYWQAFLYRAGDINPVMYQKRIIEDRETQGDVSVYRVNRPTALDSVRLLMQQESTR